MVSMLSWPRLLGSNAMRSMATWEKGGLSIGTMILYRGGFVLFVRFLFCWQTALPLTYCLLLPEQAAELLPWYMQWSRDLAAEMHLRRLVRNEARRTVTLPSAYRPCDCATEWRCEPHGACFIHDSCFCPGSGSFPPVKPPRS